MHLHSASSAFQAACTLQLDLGTWHQSPGKKTQAVGDTESGTLSSSKLIVTGDSTDKSATLN